MYLAHEVGDDAVEGRALEAVALLTSAQGAEVLRCLGDDVSSQLKINKTLQDSFLSSLPQMSQHIFSSH